MAEKKSIIYVNYSPYENSGKILDFILENFENVFLFSVGFYSLSNKKNYNKLLIYENGKLKKELMLFQIPAKKFLFLLLPLRSSISFIEIFIYSLYLKRKFKKIDFYFTVNAFTAWVGNVMKRFGFVEKTIFWVWDYYPPIHENKIIMLMRYIYWQFDKASMHSDKVIFVNRRLRDLRKDGGIYGSKSNFLVIPQGTDRLPSPEKKNNKKIVFCFFGVLKKSLGVELILKNAKLLTKEFGSDIRYEIVGSGPDEAFLKKMAKKTKIKVTFHGYQEEDSIDDILRKSTIGIATYKQEASNVSNYGDPGKIKRYLSLSIPVITTGIFEFARDIEKSKAGIVIDYNNPYELINATREIMKKTCAI